MTDMLSCRSVRASSGSEGISFPGGSNTLPVNFCEGRPVGSLSRGGRNRKGWLRIGVMNMENPNDGLELTGVVCILRLRTGEDFTMPDGPMTGSVRELSTQIVAAYVRRNQIGSDQLPTLIASVYQALGRLGEPAAAVVEQAPAVSIRRSVTANSVVCMECGWKGSMLRRHLTTAHGLTTDAYRTRWNLKPDHPITAPGYSERRSTMAKQHGFGRGGRKALESAAPKTPAMASRRRGRPRSTAAPATPV